MSTSFTDPQPSITNVNSLSDNYLVPTNIDIVRAWFLFFVFTEMREYWREVLSRFSKCGLICLFILIAPVFRCSTTL